MIGPRECRYCRTLGAAESDAIDASCISGLPINKAGLGAFGQSQVAFVPVDQYKPALNKPTTAGEGRARKLHREAKGVRRHGSRYPTNQQAWNSFHSISRFRTALSALDWFSRSQPVTSGLSLAGLETLPL